MEWISVKDRLPKVGKDVKVIITAPSINGTEYSESIGKLKRNGKFNRDFDDVKVEYWMPLPNPPKE